MSLLRGIAIGAVLSVLGVSSAQAVIITQSHTTSILDFNQAIDTTMNDGAATSDDYAYTTVSGFDASLGNLMSVNLDISQGDTVGLGTLGYDGAGLARTRAQANSSTRVAGVNSDGYSANWLNADIGAGTYDVNLATNFFDVRNVGCQDDTPSLTGIYICDKYEEDGSFISVGSIDLLSFYNIEDFFIDSIGFELHTYAAARLTGCNIASDCKAFSQLWSDLNLTISYTYDDGKATSVPEPASLALMGLGLVGLGFSRRKKAA